MPDQDGKIKEGSRSPDEMTDWTDLGDIGENHWIFRMIERKEEGEKKSIPIGRDELNNFLKITKATFAFCKAKVNGRDH